MSKIARYAGNLRAFGSNAQGLERTLFGETDQADDLTSQVTSSFLRGWGIVGPSENPSMEDFNAAMYTMSQFIAYQHQMGIPEWSALQEYYTGSLCVHAGETYSSLADGNIGNVPPSAKWTPILTTKNGSFNLGLGDFLKATNNLSEIKSAGATAVAATLANLGLGDAAKLGVATNAQMAVGTSTSLLPTVAAVMSLFSKRTFASNDYIRIPDVPGGLIIQWVKGTANASGVLFAQMPMPFPNELLLAGAFEAGAASWGDNSATAWGIDLANSNNAQVIAYARRLFPTTINSEAATGLVFVIGN
ncbi:gp53-like domain-containing protein [Yersinia aldovae]|uniref:gp53-like domain-containing protein n=1 Tax=Yersinia aldovae TaxID=29483 RepID=UPI0021BD09A5|nr:carbohydrate-binding protein [Yersinia aldovae]